MDGCVDGPTDRVMDGQMDGWPQGGGWGEGQLDGLFAWWLLNVPATGECISGTDLIRQFYVLPH